MTHTHPARTGITFSLGVGYKVYVGPDDRGKGPVLAVTEPRARKANVVATFKNSTAAEAFIDVLKQHLDTLAAAAAEPKEEQNG
jgi:hypothetical protein